MNKAYVIVMCFVSFNLVLMWFNTMGFFSYQPMGSDITYDTSEYGFANIVADGFLITGLALLGIVISIFTRINAFSMIMFCNIFWFPYYKTSGIFFEMFQDAPEAFLGIIAIFTTLMLFVFAYALIEMSSSTVMSG